MTDRFRIAILFAIVAIVLLVMAAIVGIVLVGPTEDSTPLISSLLGFAGTTLAALFALFYALGVERRTNGRIDRIVQEIDTTIAESDRPPQ